MNNIFVYCQIEDQKVIPVSLQLLTKGHSLALTLGCRLEAVAIGHNIKGIENQIFPYGADVIHVFDSPHLAPYTTLPHAAIMVKLIQQEKPQICLIGATVVGRDLGPRVSSALKSGLTADCTRLEVGTYQDNLTHQSWDNLLYQIRPAFGGNIVATIVNPHNRPQMATVREGVLKQEMQNPNATGIVVRHNSDEYVTTTDCVVKVIDRHIERARHNLNSASIVVAGGYGMGSKEGFDTLFDLARELHAEVGASRAAIDAGFCSSDRQIGQTGLTVRPKLYIACGISGQIQHLSGMQESNVIISVNCDPDAPINAIANYVIVGSVEEVIPKMIAYYKQKSI